MIDMLKWLSALSPCTIQAEDAAGLESQLQEALLDSG